MGNQQLLDYIKQQLQQGVNNDEIKKSLITNGWQGNNIEEAFTNITAPSAQPKKRRWKKIVSIVMGIIVFLFILINFLPYILGLFSNDILPIDDSDLRLQKISILDKDNGYFDLIKLDNVIYEPAEKLKVILDIVAGKTWDDNFIKEIISRNEQAFEYFTEVARKPKFQYPIYADLSKITLKTPLPPMKSWRQMAQLSAIRALYLVRQGKDKEAMEEALNAARIGQKIQDSQAPLIAYLVGKAMKIVGMETVQKIIVSLKLSSVELNKYNQELNMFYKNEDGLINFFKREYYMQTRTMDALAGKDEEVRKEIVGEEEFKNLVGKKVKNNYYFRPNKTKLLFANDARANIKNANKPCGKIRAIEKQRLAPTNPIKFYTKENAIGEILYDLMAVNLSIMSTKKCEEDILIGATQSIIAIKAYKNDTNNYPASLDELVPNYLSSVPQDPFDGKSLKYSAAKKILYSVGQDMRDLGGSAGDDWHKMPNPTFKINF